MAYTFNEIDNTLNKDLAIIYLNIRSLSAKFDSVHVFFYAMDRKFYIICFTNSWLRMLLNHCIPLKLQILSCLEKEVYRDGGLSVYVHNCCKV